MGKAGGLGKVGLVEWSIKMRPNGEFLSRVTPGR